MADVEKPTIVTNPDGSVTVSFGIKEQRQISHDHPSVREALAQANIGLAFANYGSPDGNVIPESVKLFITETGQREIGLSAETIGYLKEKGYRLTGGLSLLKILSVPGGQGSFQISNLTCYIPPEGEPLFCGELDGGRWQNFAQAFAAYLRSHPQAYQLALSEAISAIKLEPKRGRKIDAVLVSDEQEETKGFFIPPDLIFDRTANTLTTLQPQSGDKYGKQPRHYTLSQLLNLANG